MCCLWPIHCAPASTSYCTALGLRVQEVVRVLFGWLKRIADLWQEGGKYLLLKSPFVLGRGLNPSSSAVYWPLREKETDSDRDVEPPSLLRWGPMHIHQLYLTTVSRRQFFKGQWSTETNGFSFCPSTSGDLTCRHFSHHCSASHWALCAIEPLPVYSHTPHTHTSSVCSVDKSSSNRLRFCADFIPPPSYIQQP